MNRSELVKKVVAEGRERDRAIERDKLALLCKEIANVDSDLWKLDNDLLSGHIERGYLSKEDGDLWNEYFDQWTVLSTHPDAEKHVKPNSLDRFAAAREWTRRKLDETD